MFGLLAASYWLLVKPKNNGKSKSKTFDAEEMRTQRTGREKQLQHRAAGEEET
jgi:hypothetical protein